MDVATIEGDGEKGGRDGERREGRRDRHRSRAHPIDQFLHFTGSTRAEVSFARVENRTRPEAPGFQDYGEVVVTGDGGHGFVRVDGFTPDALPVWGDGRPIVLGEAGDA
jgi:hypothetical protein